MVKRVAISPGRLQSGGDDRFASGIGDVEKRDRHRPFDRLGHLVHGVGGEDQDFGAGMFQPAGDIGEPHRRRRPVASRLHGGDCCEVDRPDDQLGLAEPAEPGPRAIVEPPLIEFGRRRTHAADDADGAHHAVSRPWRRAPSRHAGIAWRAGQLEQPPCADSAGGETAPQSARIPPSPSLPRKGGEGLVEQPSVSINGLQKLRRSLRAPSPLAGEGGEGGNPAARRQGRPPMPVRPNQSAPARHPPLGPSPATGKGMADLSRETQRLGAWNSGASPITIRYSAAWPVGRAASPTVRPSRRTPGRSDW